MSVKPIGLVGGDLKVIAAADFDVSVLPTTVVRTDGSTPFVSAQPGVDPVAAADLTTKSWVQTNAGSSVWQAPVISASVTAQPGHSAGARYILSLAHTGAQWAGASVDQIALDDGTTWTFVTPSQGTVLRVLDTNTLVRFKTGTGWNDVSTEIDHNSAKNLQGGTTNQYYHLTAAQYAAYAGSQTQHYAYLAPLNSAGAPGFRAFDTSDILTGVLSPSHGGFGTSTAAVTGYSKWSGGVASFVSAIPWGDLTSVPTTFTPSAHASTHASAGSDPLALDATQLTTGVVALARGGTGTTGVGLTAKYFLASPTASSGNATYRALVPSDISGASAGGQSIRRNLANTGNEWADLSTVYTVITRQVATTGYLSGGGALSTDLTLSWLGMDVALAGVVTARRPVVNFVGAAVSVADNVGTGQVDVTITSPAISMDPIVAAIVFGS